MDAWFLNLGCQGWTVWLQLRNVEAGRGCREPHVLPHLSARMGQGAQLGGHQLSRASGECVCRGGGGGHCGHG